MTELEFYKSLSDEEFIVYKLIQFKEVLLTRGSKEEIAQRMNVPLYKVVDGLKQKEDSMEFLNLYEQKKKQVKQVHLTLKTSGGTLLKDLDWGLEAPEKFQSAEKKEE